MWSEFLRSIYCISIYTMISLWEKLEKQTCYCYVSKAASSGTHTNASLPHVCRPSLKQKPIIAADGSDCWYELGIGVIKGILNMCKYKKMACTLTLRRLTVQCVCELHLLLSATLKNASWMSPRWVTTWHQICFFTSISDWIICVYYYRGVTQH